MILGADPNDIDLGSLTGLGVLGALLGLVFRTLWKQEGGWRSVLNASREDAKLARDDAAAARIDAAAARADTRAARGAEAECRRALAHLQEQVDELTLIVERRGYPRPEVHTDTTTDL